MAENSDLEGSQEALGEYRVKESSADEIRRLKER
jgi:hypothetical protein